MTLPSHATARAVPQVLLEPDGGATSIVLGGSNTAFPRVRPTGVCLGSGRVPGCLPSQAQLIPPPCRAPSSRWDAVLLNLLELLSVPGLQEAPEALAHLMEGTGVVMLQREVPEHVNEAVAAAAAKAGVPVLLVRQGGRRAARAACSLAPATPAWRGAAPNYAAFRLPPHQPDRCCLLRRTWAARTAPFRTTCCRCSTMCAPTSLSWRG